MSLNLLSSLTLDAVLRDIPHNVSAFVTYALLGIFVAFVWMGHRNSAGSAVRHGRPLRSDSADAPRNARNRGGETVSAGRRTRVPAMEARADVSAWGNSDHPLPRGGGR